MNAGQATRTYSVRGTATTYNAERSGHSIVAANHGFAADSMRRVPHRGLRKGAPFPGRTTYDAFAADERTRDAVIRNLEIIGEAAGKLPKEVTARAPQIPWRLISDMRNVLAHAYFGVSLKVVWDTATAQIEELENAVRASRE